MIGSFFICWGVIWFFASMLGYVLNQKPNGPRYSERLLMFFYIMGCITLTCGLMIYQDEIISAFTAQE